MLLDDSRSESALNQPDIIVSTSADFAVARRGRPVAAARWEDVVRVRASRRPTVCLDVELVGGARIAVDEDSPGWDDFLSDLETQLPGAVGSESWLADLAQAGSAHESVLVFDRRG